MYTEQGYLRSKSGQKRAGLDAPGLFWNKSFILRKYTGTLKAKMLPLFTYPPWLKKDKKHPVFFKHFCLYLTWFSGKIKPIVIVLYTFHLSQQQFIEA
jgi:hypothetical protein